MNEDTKYAVAEEMPVPAIMAAPAAKLEPVKKRPTPGLLGAVFKASTPANGAAISGGEIFKRNRVTFPVPAKYCTVPFPEDFELTIVESSPDDEMESARVAENGSMVIQELAKRSMDGLNGEKITEITRGWLWNALGQRGRTLVVAAYAHHMGVDAEGKGAVMAAVMGARLE